MRALAHYSWFLLAILAICVLSVADDIVRHTLAVVVLGIVASVAAYITGRAHGRAEAGER